MKNRIKFDDIIPVIENYPSDEVIALLLENTDFTNVSLDDFLLLYDVCSDEELMSKMLDVFLEQNKDKIFHITDLDHLCSYLDEEQLLKLLPLLDLLDTDISDIFTLFDLINDEDLVNEIISTYLNNNPTIVITYKHIEYYVSFLNETNLKIIVPKIIDKISLEDLIDLGQYIEYDDYYYNHLYQYTIKNPFKLPLDEYLELIENLNDEQMIELIKVIPLTMDMQTYVVSEIVYDLPSLAQEIIFIRLCETLEFNDELFSDLLDCSLNYLDLGYHVALKKHNKKAIKLIKQYYKEEYEYDDDDIFDFFENLETWDIMAIILTIKTAYDFTNKLNEAKKRSIK